MNNDGNVFEILLSAGELFWLAQAMKIKHLPLPEDPYRGWLVDEIEQDLNSGRESLQARSLVDKTADGDWHIDDILYAAVRCMAESSCCVAIRSITAAGDDAHLFTFILEQQFLCLEWNTKRFRILLFREQSDLISFLVPQIGITNQAAADTKIRTVKAQAVKNWIENGIYDSGLSDFAFITSLSKVEWIQQKPRLTRQYLLAGNPDSLWSAIFPLCEGREIKFDPFSTNEAQKLITGLLSSDSLLMKNPQKGKNNV